MTTIPFNPIAMNPPPERVEDAESQTVAGNTCMTVVSSSPSEPTPRQWMRLVEMSGTLDFWNDPDEDIYTPEDGQPIL